MHRLFIFLLLIAILVLKMKLLTEAQKCVKLNHESTEFRFSAENYSVTDMTPSHCQSLCRQGNFSYAAVMVDKYCLCSYTNEDYPEINVKCCSDLPVKCPDDPDIIKGMEVDDLEELSLALEITLENMPMTDVVVARYSVSGESNVPVMLSLFYDGVEIEPSQSAVIPKITKQTIFTNPKVPGLHRAKAKIVDIKTNSIAVEDEKEILVPDKEVVFDLYCTEFLKIGEMCFCSTTIFHGMDLKLEIQFGDEETQTFILSDVEIMSIGPSIPQIPTAVTMKSNSPFSPEIVYLGLGKLPAGVIVGIEYFASIAGQFEVQVLEPKCGESETYCGSCSNTCPEEGLSVCSEGKETFCSLIGGCALLDDPPSCFASEEKEYTKADSITITAIPGYQYYPLEKDKYTKIRPGFIIALKRIFAPVIPFVEPMEEEIENGFIDRDDSGKMLNIKHLVKIVVVLPANFTYVHNFSQPGNYKIFAELRSESEDVKATKEVTVTVADVMSGLTVEEPSSCTLVGESAVLEASLETGENVTFLWSPEEQESITSKYSKAPEILKQEILCRKGGNFTVTVKAADAYNSETASVTVCCLEMVTRDWTIESNSPQITPPGDITLRFKYSGDDAEKFSYDCFIDFDFGNGELSNGVLVKHDGKEITLTHTYKQSGTYNVTIYVYNEFDSEIFVTEVKLLDKLTILQVSPFYKMEEESELLEFHGPEKTDVPIKAIVNFECFINGSIEKYRMKIDGKEMESENNMFFYEMNNVGEYIASFQAFNLLEDSNIVFIEFRVLTSTDGLTLTASSASLMPLEEDTFTIEFKTTDDFTCLTFDPGDGEIKQAFLNEKTCGQLMKEKEFHFNPRGSKRRRRETEEVSWIDDNIISIKYIYHSGGIFHPKAEAFNTIFRNRATTVVEVVHPFTPIWIENNSTYVKKPMKYYRKDTFRLETTALLMDNPLFSYTMNWEVDEITESGSFIRNVNISSIRSSTLSAIRFPARFLDVGLYNVKYYIKVIINENKEEFQTLSCFTYLEILSSPLLPMAIKGGASYILRGYNQLVYLEAGKYSEDPDDPEDKEFKAEWTCRYLEARDFLTEGEEYDPRISLSSRSITPHQVAEKDFKDKCFSAKDGAEILKQTNLVLNTKDLHSSDALYEFTLTISKDFRKNQSWIYLDVIKDKPPGIIIMCEKKVACTIFQDGFIINPSDWLPVRAECVTDCGSGKIVYDWNIYGINDTFDAVDLKGWKDFIVIDEDRLGINKTFFQNFHEFKYFHMQVTGIDTIEDRPKGVAKLHLKINNPPKPGQCVSPLMTGLAMIGIFRTEFIDWTDPDKHSLVDYSLYMNYGGKKFRLHYGVKTSVDFILPPGECEVICTVQDQLGAVTSFTMGKFMAVMPAREMKEIWESTINMRFFVIQGKMSLLSQAMAAEAIVDEIDQEEDYESVAEEVDRIWKEYMEMSGIDSSYFTKEAREEIEAEVRDRRADGKTALADTISSLFEYAYADLRLKPVGMNPAIEFHVHPSHYKNFEMLLTLEEGLPFEALPDAEVYGQAVSTLAETKPLNKESKHVLNQLLEEMYKSSLEEEVAHPTDREVSNMLLANSMNCLSKSLSEEMLGGNFLKSELEKVYDFLSYNLTQPNFFILYVGGSRWEVEEKVHNKKVEGAKNMSENEAQDQVKQLKKITNTMTTGISKDVMVGEHPLTVNTTSGFQLTVEKKRAEELSGATIEGEGSSVKLPDACILLGQDKGCEASTSIGIISTRWTNILEIDGTENVNLSPGSNTLDFSLTNREGNENLKVKNATEPFEICLAISQPSEDEQVFSRTSKLRHVQPYFGEKDAFLVYHKLNLDKSDGAVKIEFSPDKENLHFVFFYGRGYKPSLLVHDGRIFIKDLDENKLSYNILIAVNDNDGKYEKEFYFAVGHLSNESFGEEAIFSSERNLSRDDMTNEFQSGYSIGLFKTGCYYFSEEMSAWSSDGCKVHSAKADMICCLCNHLTMFGSGFLVAPNQIDFSYVFANANFEDNVTIYSTLIVTFSIYIILIIWARWKDKKDLKKLGATPLLDNDIQDKYFYEILVQTGFQYNAGTKSKVHFILSGEDDETEVRTFTDDQREIFKRGAMNMFVMSVPRCLGQLNYLRIWHDNSGKGSSASWYLKYVVVKDIHTGLKYEFIADRWFAVEEGNGMIDHLIPVAGKEQTTEFSHLFSNASRRNLTDNHIWLSVFTRPARSRFTRVQRLSCCLALLYLSMLTSAMWYQTTPEQPSPGAFKFGPLSLSPEQIGVGIMSNLIIFPPSFLMVFFFRKSRARSLRPSHVNVALENQYERWRKNYGTLNKTEETSKSQKKQQRKVDEEAQLRNPSKKKRFLLPWWCTYISWLLVVVSVGCSIFFLWAYGLQFGNVRTTKWLTSLLISFISSVLLTEPIKIFCLAVLMACLCGNPDVDDDDADDDEEDPYLKQDEEWLHNVNPGISIQRPKYRPIDLQALEAARKIREKEIRMHKLLKEITTYALYLWILMILSYGNRDPNSFYLRETIINNFIKPGDLWHDFNEVTTEVKFWNWTRNALLPELFAGLWYNGRKPLGLRLLLDDRNNFKVGYPVLRQVRARKDSCFVPWQMESVVSECAGYGGLINEQNGFYEKQWNSNITVESKVPPEYKYMTASELNGFPFWGQLDWYGGGGFIVPLIAKRYEDGEKLIAKMLELEKTSWINRDTRAVFVEFGTYNAQVNLFVVSTIVAEFLPGGGIVPYYHIDPIKLLHYHTGAGLLQLGCQIAFLFFTAYYTVYELSASCKQGKSYFTEYWNIAELANLCAAYAAIGVEIYKMIITWRILEIFTATEGTGYIKLQEALILDEAFCYLIGFLMSLATLKFLKLLRFNKRIGSMIATLRLCARELKGYGVCLLITFFAFVALFWLILGHAVREFCTFLAAFESSISMMLKKFNYEDMEAASPILAPLAFFTFALTASVILVNILLTIIIQSFEEVKYDVKLQNNDYELVPFIIGRLKLFLGIQKNQNKILPVGLKEVENKTNVMDSFNGKVDLLLNFINSVYLDEQMDVEFLKKSKAQFSSVSDTKPEKKKYRPKRIPRHNSLIMKKHLDF